MTTYVQVDQFLMTYLLFGLVLIRCSGLVVFAPFFGAEQFPSRARILLAVFLAILFLPLAGPTAQIPARLDVAELAVLVLQELSIGLVIGFLSSLVFVGTQLGGQLVGQQIGFAMANVVDPMTDREVSIIGFLNMNLAIVVFLVTKLHLAVIWLMKLSFDTFAIGSIAFGDTIGPMNEVATVHAQAMFVVALQMAMPILLVMLLNSVVEGFVTRTMPQMNIMVLGLPLRVVLGMTVLMLVMPSLVLSMEGMLERMVEGLGLMFA